MGNLMIGTIYPPSLGKVDKVYYGNELCWPVMALKWPKYVIFRYRYTSERTGTSDLVSEEDYYFPVDLQTIYDTYADGVTYFYTGKFTTEHESYYEDGLTEHIITMQLTPNKLFEHLTIVLELDGKHIYPPSGSSVYVEAMEQVASRDEYVRISYISTRYPFTNAEIGVKSLEGATVITKATPTGDSPIRFQLSERLPPIVTRQTIDINEKWYDDPADGSVHHRIPFDVYRFEDFGSSYFALIDRTFTEDGGASYTIGVHLSRRSGYIGPLGADGYSGGWISLSEPRDWDATYTVVTSNLGETPVLQKNPDFIYSPYLP